MDKRLTFSANSITVGDLSWSTPYPVHDARWVGHRIIAIYDYRSSPNSVFNNLEAFDETGHKLWTAENPGDVYVDFMSEIPLVVWQFACLRCTIDVENGRVLDVVFSK
jgi:hypothetical protein